MRMFDTRLLTRVSRTLTMMSYTWPSSTCSSMSARARTWSGEWGSTACIQGMQNIDRGMLRQPTTNMSQWYEVPFISLLSGLFTILSAIFWSMKKRRERGKPSIIPARITFRLKFEASGIWKTSWTWKIESPYVEKAEGSSGVFFTTIWTSLSGAT